ATTTLNEAVEVVARIVGGGLEKATETGNLEPLSEPSQALSSTAAPSAINRLVIDFPLSKRKGGPFFCRARALDREPSVSWDRNATKGKSPDEDQPISLRRAVPLLDFSSVASSVPSLSGSAFLKSFSTSARQCAAARSGRHPLGGVGDAARLPAK